jgi:Flp pilus assembly protein TadD
LRSKTATWMLVALLALGGAACQTDDGEDEASEEMSEEASATETVTETETETEGSETEKVTESAAPATTAPAP